MSALLFHTQRNVHLYAEPCTPHGSHCKRSFRLLDFILCRLQLLKHIQNWTPTGFLLWPHLYTFISGSIITLIATGFYLVRSLRMELPFIIKRNKYEEATNSLFPFFILYFALLGFGYFGFIVFSSV